MGDRAFRDFLARHQSVEAEGIAVVGEDHDDIMGAYAMIDPLGRFFDDTGGRHRYSAPILAVGVAAAFDEIVFSPGRFLRRGGVYQWRPLATRGQISNAAPGVVAFVGRSGCGKDTAAGALVEHGYGRVAVADPLKRAMQALFELTEDQLWGAGRDVVDARLGATPRSLCQRFSDACRAIDPRVWLRPWEAEIRRRVDAGERVVCTDVRTWEELAIIRALGGRVIRVRRTGAGATGDAARHATEVELDALRDDDVDAVIVNDGSLEELRAAACGVVLGR